jgi:hypothetical protein
MTLMFAVDKNNDLYLDDKGNIALVTGLEAVKQACEHAVKAQLGEMVLQVDQGMPNFQVVWNGAPNIAQFEAALYTRLMGVSGVTNVKNLTTTVAQNALSYTVTIVTIYGEAAINGNL